MTTPENANASTDCHPTGAEAVDGGRVSVLQVESAVGCGHADPGDFQERCHSLAAFQAAWINGSA